MARDVQSLLAEARESAADGEVERALELYGELCDREPYNPDFWLERAGIAESVGQVNEAADMIFHVVELLAAAGMGEASELAQRILSLAPEHEGARSFLSNLGKGRAGQPGDPVVGAGSAVTGVPVMSDDVREESGQVSGVVAGMVYDSLPAIESARDEMAVVAGASPADGGGAIPEPITDEVSDGVPMAVIDEPSGWKAASVPLPTVDMPSGPVAVAAMREAAGERHGFGEVRYSRPRPATMPGIPVIDVAGRLAALPSPLLDALDEDGRQAMLDTGTLHRRRRHEAIFHQGDIGSSLYVVVEGRVDIERHDPATGTIRRLATLESGAFFGEMALVAGISRSATVRAATDVVLFKISRQSVRELSERDERLLEMLNRFFRARLVGTLMATSSLFHSLSADQRRALITQLKLRELPPDRVVLRQGRDGDGLYLVLLGRLVAGLQVGDSRTVDLGEIDGGDVFGEMSSLSGEPAMATIRTRERVWLLRLPVEEFARLIEQHPKVRDALHEIAETRRAKNRELLETATSDDVF